jgi:site-specific recombinase XerD
MAGGPPKTIRRRVMGSIYRPKYRGADGTLKESAVIWLKYRDALGVLRRESSETEKEHEAKRRLKQREGAAVEGRVVPPRSNRVTVAELAEGLKANYRANGRRSIRRLELSLAHLLPVFGPRRAMHLTGDDVTTYRNQRLEAKAAPATVNRELAALKRMFSLAVKAERLHRSPPIEMLKENNARRGFFEREQFEAVRRHLPEDLRSLVTVAYVTGWRITDALLPLEWRQVDFRANTLRLEPGTTKNDEGRIFAMTPELRAALEAQKAATEQLQRQGRIIRNVFHRRGKPIKSFKKSWATACLRAGCPGRIPHDFRRTSVRNLERAGVSRSAAMRMVGHKTESVYRRYAIVSDSDLHEASAKLARLDAAQSPGQSGRNSSAP